MPPIRRYVRISPHSCLEVRIFLENPADVTSWLLRRSNPALPRVFDAVKPLILPKLREENERTRLAREKKGGKKKKGVKDVVKGDDFEVVVFLTEGQGRHEVVVKRKEAQEGGWRFSDDRYGQETEPLVIQEESEDEVNFDNIPKVQEDTEKVIEPARKVQNPSEDDEDVQDLREDKKKLGFHTRYEGFTIWGKVLCLLIERKGVPGRSVTARISTSSRSETSPETSTNAKVGTGGAQQALMQEWISSTQLAQDEDDNDDDNDDDR